MNGMTVKITIALLLVAGAATYLAVAGVQDGWVYYVDVDEFQAKPELHDQRVRICGMASPDQFVSEPGRLTASFTVEGETSRIPVVYQGVIPDQFKPGAEVVLEGKLDENGVFQATVLLTKCASKYQAEDHAKRLRDQP